MKASFERDDTGLPGCLACVLERRLDRLRTGVAEERLGATEAIGEPSRKCLRRLRAVQVGRVPETLELLACRGERSRMTVSERDHRDPASEVEILAAAGVPDPRPVAAHDREICSRVGGKEPLEAL